MYYKARQVVLQSRAGITKSGNFYCKVERVLKSGATFITISSWEFLRRQTSVRITKKKKSHSHHRRICVTCKLEKQLLRGVSCTENYCSYTLIKSFGNYSLRRVITITQQVQLHLNYSP